MKRAALFLLALSAAACGGAQQSTTTPTTPLAQARALEVIEQAIADRDYGAVTHDARARLPNGTVIGVDVLVRDLGAGFAYLTDQDRLDLGDATIPEPAEGSDLYVLLGQLLPGGERLRVMIIQDSDFEYLPNPRADQREPEQRTIDDVEVRLRRDSLDFLQALVNDRSAPPSP